MALADSRWQRVTMLCALYFAQGLPWGFMVTAVVAYLIDDHGISPNDVAYLSTMVMLPWSFKLVWAPLIDCLTIRSMGRRRVWIIGAQLMMAASLFAILGVDDLTGDITQLGWFFFVHNCFVSLQDVATDALAVDVLPPHEQGTMNGLMWSFKLFGKASAGYVMAEVISAWGLTASIGVMAASILVIMLFPLFFIERSGEKRFPWSRGHAVGFASRTSVRNPVSVIIDLFRAFSLTSTLALLVFATFCVFGWGVIEVVTRTAFITELGWDDVEFGRVTFYSALPALICSVGGGFLADRLGRRTIIAVGFLLYGLMHMTFASLPDLWSNEAFAWSYLVFNPGALVIGTIGFTALSMKVSWTRAAASMFTIYMTLSNLGHAAGNKVAGWLLEECALSSQQVFWVAGVVTVAPVVLLPLVNTAQVDSARARERLERVSVDGVEDPGA